MFVRTQDVEEVATSHGTQMPVRKRALVLRGVFPHIMQFARATVKGPIDTRDGHVHQTMVEWYYIISGRALFRVGPEERTVEADELVLVPPNTEHSFVVAEGEELELLYGGVSTE